MKTFDEFKNDLGTLRTDLNATTYRVEKVQELLSDLVEKLDGLYDQSVSNKDQAADLVRAVDTIKPHKNNLRITPKHFRMMALLNEYGAMHRENLARILGVSEKTITQMQWQIHRNHLGSLKTRRGVVILNAIGDGVSDNDNFKLI